jgi:hypothetical protein
MLTVCMRMRSSIDQVERDAGGRIGGLVKRDRAGDDGEAQVILVARPRKPSGLYKGSVRPVGGFPAPVIFGNRGLYESSNR